MSEAAPGLVVDSVTGIDVSLPVAGPGARAYAFLVDWHIRVILALGWFVLGALLYNGRFILSPPLSSDARWFGAVVAPALAIYFLYHHVVELALRGSTPGKRMAGVRIVARDGGAASVGALLTRNVFRLLDSLPLFYGVGLITVVLTREHLRIGDMAAGTLLVFEQADARLPAPAAAAQRGSQLDAAGAEIVAELLERWPALQPEARVRLARQVLTRYAGELGEPGDDDRAWRTRLERLAHPR
ncbi:MAG TPA: RDD family protein [Steroidobacteraceae bacterium]|nr:RDD family protein [Steroidobacteraceae bacterium]